MSQVWFVTGSSRGLGRSIVEQALIAGHRVGASARRIDELQGLADDFGERLCLVNLDVTAQCQVNDAVRTVIERFGCIDVIVNNAACASVGPIEDLSDAQFRAQMETTFFGAVNVTKAVLPHFRERRSGHFFQISSIAARGHFKAGISGYHSAKAALEAFSGCLAEETKHLGIKVTVIEPAAMRTAFTAPRDIGLIREDYRESIDQVAKKFFERAGSEKVDPTLVAKLLVELAGHDDPPFRLLLGSEAIDYAEGHSKQEKRDDADWAEVSRSVDFAG